MATSGTGLATVPERQSIYILVASQVGSTNILKLVVVFTSLVVGVTVLIFKSTPLLSPTRDTSKMDNDKSSNHINCFG
jgi:hypothetical protein